MLESADLPESFTRELRREVRSTAGARARTMAAVRREAARPVRRGLFTPAAAMLLAASITIALVGGWLNKGADVTHHASLGSVQDLGTSIRDTILLVRFAFSAPKAAKVALVGDFTKWESKPLVRNDSGAWVADVPVTRGRHSYAYVVDDTQWVANADGSGPLAPNGRRARSLLLPKSD